MLTMKSISTLKNYNELLCKVMENAELELMSALAAGEASAQESGWVSMDVAMKRLGAN